MYNPYLMNGALTTGGRGALSGARGGGAEREAARDAGSDLRGRRGQREHEQREQREDPAARAKARWQRTRRLRQLREDDLADDVWVEPPEAVAAREAALEAEWEREFEAAEERRWGIDDRPRVQAAILEYLQQVDSPESPQQLRWFASRMKRIKAEETSKIAKARKEARHAFERAWTEFEGTARHSMLTGDAAEQLKRALERKMCW